MKEGLIVVCQTHSKHLISFATLAIESSSRHLSSVIDRFRYLKKPYLIPRAVTSLQPPR